MAKPTGFMEYDREEAAERPFLERIQDWQPIHLHMLDEKLQTQAARCMDCGIPFCHKGRVLNRMVTGCPLNNLIPEWNDLIYQGLWHEAYERLNKTNNFPEFTGLVCPAPCEAGCTLGINDPPVTIKGIEFAIIDKAFDAGWVRVEIPATRTGKRIAVVGSGPAGLACAAQLNHVGHLVTVFERADRIGGLLTYGIPNVKLDKGMVERRVDVMRQAGIQFEVNTEIGTDYPVEKLKTAFDAIVLCTGSTRPRDLPIEGRALKGIHFAVDFLHANTKSLLDSAHEDEQFISAAGRNVVVIGGGDTGTDCVATSLRQKCDGIVQFEIMPQPPLERAADNPWPQWPMVYKQDYGQKEATAVYGKEPRTYSIMSEKFVGDGDGNVKEVHTVAVEWQFVGEQYTPVKIAGTEKVWPTQLVLLAMGFLGPENPLLVQLGVEQNGRFNINAEYGQFNTNVDGIFTAGDARRGQSLVVWAIDEGRGAAREVDRWLMGETDLP